MRLEQSFGERVRALRTQRNFTQEDLASRSGCSVDSIRRIERGELSPSLSTMSKIASGLNLRLPTLFWSFDDGCNGDEPLVDHICDFLHHLEPREVRKARTVLEAVLSPVRD